MQSAFFPAQQQQHSGAVAGGAAGQAPPHQQQQQHNGAAPSSARAWAPSPSKTSLVVHTRSPVRPAAPGSVGQHAAHAAAHTTSSVGVGRNVRFPSSRWYLWDRTPAAPQVLIDLLDYLPQLQVAVSAFGAINRAAASGAATLKLQLSLSVASTHQVSALIQEHDPLRVQEGLQLPCVLTDPAAVAPDDAASLRALLQAQADQRDIARLQQLFALSASAAAAASPDAPSCLQLQLLMPALGLLAMPLYTKRLCHVPLAEALLKPGRMAPGQTGYLSMDQARSLLPLEATDASVYSTPLVGVWVKGPASVLHPLVGVACLRFAFSSLLMDRAVSTDGGAAFLLLLCPEGDPVSKCFEVCMTDSSSMPLAAFRCEAGLAPAVGLAQYPGGLAPAQWVQQQCRVPPLPGPLAAATAPAAASGGCMLALPAPPQQYTTAGAGGAGSPVTPGLQAHRAVGSLPAERSSAPSALLSHTLMSQQRHAAAAAMAAAASATRRSLPLHYYCVDSNGAPDNFGAAPGRADGWSPHHAQGPQPRAGVPGVPYGTAPGPDGARGGVPSWRQQQQWVRLGEQLLEPQHPSTAGDAEPFAAASAPPMPPGAAAYGKTAPYSAVAGVPTPGGGSSPTRGARLQQQQQQALSWSERQQAVLRSSLENAADALHHSQASLAAAAEAARGKGGSSRQGSPIKASGSYAAAAAGGGGHAAAAAAGGGGSGISTPTVAHPSSPALPPAAAGSPQPGMSRLGQQRQQQQQGDADADSECGVPRMGSPVRASMQRRAAMGAAAAASPGAGGHQEAEEDRPASPSVQADVALSNLSLLQHLSSGQLQQALHDMPSPQQHSTAAALRSSLEATSSAAAALASASAAMQRVPAAHPYGHPSMGVQRYAADAAAMQGPPASAGLWSPASAAAASGGPGAYAHHQQQQRAPAAAWSPEASPPAGGEYGHAAGSSSAYGSPWGHQQQLCQQVSPVSPALLPGGWSTADPVAQALHDEVDRLRQELQQLQRNLRMAGMSVIEAGISVAPPAAAVLTAPPTAAGQAAASWGSSHPAMRPASAPCMQEQAPPATAAGGGAWDAPAVGEQLQQPVAAAAEQPSDSSSMQEPCAASSAQQPEPPSHSPAVQTVAPPPLDSAAGATAEAVVEPDAAGAQSRRQQEQSEQPPSAAAAEVVPLRRRKLEFGGCSSSEGSSSSGSEAGAAQTPAAPPPQAAAPAPAVTAAHPAKLVASPAKVAGSPVAARADKSVSAAAAAAAAASAPVRAGGSRGGRLRSSVTRSSAGSGQLGGGDVRLSLEASPLVDVVRTRIVDLSDDSDSEEWEQRLLVKYGLS